MNDYPSADILSSPSAPERGREHPIDGEIVRQVESGRKYVRTRVAMMLVASFAATVPAVANADGLKTDNADYGALEQGFTSAADDARQEVVQGCKEMQLMLTDPELEALLGEGDRISYNNLCSQYGFAKI